MPALETYGKNFQSYEYLIHMFQFFINRNWSPLRHISENNSVQFKINWPLKASLNRGSEVIGSEHLCIHDNILNFYQWLDEVFHVPGPFLTDIPPHTRHRNLNAWKGVSQGRSSATCVEGGGVVPVSSSQPPVDPWAGGGASVWSPPPPHSTHQLMGGRQAARTELSHHQQQPTVKHTRAQRAQVRGGDCGHTLLRLSVNVSASFLLLWISRKPWKY